MKTVTPPAPPTLGPVLEFLRLLWRVDHALQRLLPIPAGARRAVASEREQRGHGAPG